MAVTENQISSFVHGMSVFISCPDCKTRVRYGDYECPRCGHDIEDQLRAWATYVLESLKT